MENHFLSFIELVDAQESSLRNKGLTNGAMLEDLESLINSVEALLETANELFDKVG